MIFGILTQLTLTLSQLLSGVLASAEAEAQSPNVEYSRASLLQQAEQVKKRLSQQDEVMITLDHHSLSVSVLEFHESCSHLFRRAMDPVHRLLADLNMTKEDVDEIVLVGGTTRVPKIKELLRNFFGKKLNDHIDPDVTVAYGAASVVD